MKMRTTAIGAGFALIIAATLGGCAASSVKTAPIAAPAKESAIITGKVLETMDGGGYTYVYLLEKSGAKTWAALPLTKVAVGDELKILNGAEMPGFSSSALNRTFDKIIFSGGVYQDAQAAAAAAAAAKAQPQVVEPEQPTVLAGKIVETMDAAAYTYVLLEKDGKRGWVAVPSTDVKLGEEIEVIPGINMGIFKSAQLKKTFNGIHFSAGIKGREARVTKPAPAAPAAAQQPPITGKVVQTAHAGGYTYICLEKDGKQTWAAVPAMDIKVGQELSLAPGSVMNNFVSKSLNRTFDKIIFTSRPTVK